MGRFWQELTYWHIVHLALLALAIYFVPRWPFRWAIKRWPQDLKALREILFSTRCALGTFAFLALPDPEPHARLERLRQVLAFWHVYVPLTLVLCCIWLIPRWIATCALTRWNNHSEAIRSARILARILFAALLLDEGSVRIIRLPAILSEVYTLTYAAKWEFFALLATAVISYEYWRAHKKRIKQIRRMDGTHYAKTTDYLVCIWLCLLCAFLSFVVTVFSGSETLFQSAFYVHLAFLIALSLCFWRADYHIYCGIKTQRPTTEDQKQLRELKRMSHSLVYFVDIPTFVSLCLLGTFLVIHWAEHYFGHPLSPFLERPPKSPEPVNVWTSEDYFVIGMVAFQFLTMTVVSVVLGFNPKPDKWTTHVKVKKVVEDGSLISE